VYVNGTIRSWIHYLEVRMEEGVTQWEHVLLARLIAEQVNAVFKVADIPGANDGTAS
jgi:thymidylate synthase ThyX